MRYEPFLFDQDTEGVEYVHDPAAMGLMVIPNNISEIEKEQNRGQCRVLEGIGAALAETFELPNLCLETTGHWHSFFLREREEGDYEWGLNSPKLSREKLKDAQPYDIAGAVIDLLVHQNEWTERHAYKRLHL